MMTEEGKNKYVDIALSSPERTVEQEFYEHLRRWREETDMLSSVTQIVQNDSFKRIVSLGSKAVPYILNEISAIPSNLVWALNMIYNRRISNDRNTTVKEACKLWIKELS